MSDINYLKNNITAIIVIYDVTSQIFECLNNLKYIKIIIIDNGNCDKKIIDKLLQFKNIKYIKSKKNLGFGRANNFAFKLVKTKYTLLINADVVTTTNDLINLLKTLESYPNTAIAVPLMVDEKNENFDHIEVLPEIGEKFAKIDENKIGLKKNLLSGDTCISFCWAAIMLLNNSVVKKVGLFNKKYFLYWEDYELCRKLFFLKLPIVKSYKSKALHLKHASVNYSILNYFTMQFHHVYSSYLYFNLKKKDSIISKRIFVYLFRFLTYLMRLKIKKSIKNLARLVAIIKYKLKK